MYDVVETALPKRGEFLCVPRYLCVWVCVQWCGHSTRFTSIMEGGVFMELHLGSRPCQYDTRGIATVLFKTTGAAAIIANVTHFHPLIMASSIIALLLLFSSSVCAREVQVHGISSAASIQWPTRLVAA